MNNVLAIDLEDWHQLVHRRMTGELIDQEPRVFAQLDFLLELFAEHNVRATFFVLGMLAERYPELVKRVAYGGHEVASHGYAHVIVHRATPAQFREDTKRSKRLLEDITGHTVCGYRAAEFSIRQNSLWALEMLRDLGFSYDASILPIRRHRYGVSGFNRGPHRYGLPHGDHIVELPLSAVEWAGARLPIGGGGYFRVLPARVIHSAVRRLNAVGLPLITCFHPYEFDPEPLDVRRTVAARTLPQRARAQLFNFRQNMGRRTMRAKLASLLQNFRFSTCQEYVDACGFAGSRELLSAHAN